MPRMLLAGLVATAVLACGSISLITWSTSYESDVSSAPQSLAAPMAVTQVSLPASLEASPQTAPMPVTTPVASAPPRAPPSTSALAERARSGNASDRPLGGSSARGGGTPGANRLVTSARDRHLRVAHPEILAQPRRVAAASVVTLEDQDPSANAPCLGGTDCDAPQDVYGTVEVMPPDGVDDAAMVSQ